MLKICICSDNHGNMTSIKQILKDNYDCDYYFHLGDSLFSEKQLEPFITVLGNCDYYNLQTKRVIDIKGHRFLLIHGNGYTNNMDSFVSLAKKEKADVVLYGHTHIFKDEVIDGIRFINPGSTYHNRDFSEPCYAMMYIDDEDNIRVERINLE